MTGAARPFALVTGASSGIGFELAREFVGGGYDLLICAEDDGIYDAADRVRKDGASVEALQVDLRTYEGVERLYAAAIKGGRVVDAAALNAGVGAGGAFVDTELRDELSIVALNVASTVHLAKRLLQDMNARNAGRILVTSSIASTLPGSFQAVYNASKSFLQSFTIALQDELKDTDITVTSLMPGATETNFFVRAGMADNTRIGRSSAKDDPAAVAAQGYAALMAGRSKVAASSLSTKAQEKIAAVLPDRVKSRLHRVAARPTR